jgi:hemerythrin
MPEYLDKVREIIVEHRSILGYVKLVGDSISDKEALTSLEKARRVSGGPEALAQKVSQLKQALSRLDEGLKNHFAREEEWLPPVFGKFLMRALLIEHAEMQRAIDDARSAALATGVEKMSQKELVAWDASLRKLVSRLSRLIRRHARMEDRVLGMLERALLEEG